MASPRLLLGLACLGVSVCAACGSSFTGDKAGAAGDAGAGALSADGGSSTSAGSDSGAAGEVGGGTAGETSAGTAGMNGGSTSSAGSGGSSAGTGGSSAGTGGGSSGNGGAVASGGNAGAGGVPDCKTLEGEYATLLAKARVCDKAATDQCSPSSTLPGGTACGCPVLVNAKSTSTDLAKKKYQQLQDNKCLTGPICTIACLSPKGASCEQQTSGTGTAYQCTASNLVLQ